MLGVAQGMRFLGHEHYQVTFRESIQSIHDKVNMLVPDIIWTHMLLWPSEPGIKQGLIDLCTKWKKRGTRVILHDGDAKIACRHPQDISDFVDIALCNHVCDRSAWKVDCLNWPYFAFNQNSIADKISKYECDLAFAGTLASDGVYNERTDLVNSLIASGIKFKVFGRENNTLTDTPALAASATSVLGFGRREIPGWTDVRVFQYPGAGGVLIHDHAEHWLTPHEHYIPYTKGNIDSIKLAVEESKKYGSFIRKSAFEFVQKNHSSTVRCLEVLTRLGLIHD